MPTRTELIPDKPMRQTIDADWSSKKKALVAGGASTLAIAAVALGVWAFQASRPLSVPTTTGDAIAVLSSAKFEKLPSDRKSQITAAARGLLADLPDDQRRELFRDEDNRDAMRALMQATFDETARRYARGEELDAIRREMGFGGPGRGGPPGGRRGGGDGQRTPDEELTEEQREEREERRAQRMAQFQSRIADAFNTGSAQAAALRGEMFKRMRGEREASGEQPRRRN